MMNEKSNHEALDITIPEKDIEFEFIHSSGPGGQNVNKVSSAVLLRFDTNSQIISEEVRKRLEKQNQNRITKDGILMIKAQRYRSQEKNRADAIQRLRNIIKRASKKPKVRKKTTVPNKSRKKRLEDKRFKSQKKSLRKRISKEE